MVKREPKYVGRFAPSPTGPLHLGSLCTALASWLDARVAGGAWLLRIEDIDRERCRRDHAIAIIQCLKAHGLQHDGPIGWQSRRQARYLKTLERLVAQGRAYLCSCSRKQIETQLIEMGWLASPDAERPYPGHCRAGMRKSGSGAWRFIVPAEAVSFQDRFAGEVLSSVEKASGDFVIFRADAQVSYHLAAVVDDEVDGVTDVVRGDDLLPSTARQIALQQSLGYRRLRYFHLPVLRDDKGQKLSKQQGAPPLQCEHALENLRLAGGHLGLGDLQASSVQSFLEKAKLAWARLDWAKLDRASLY